MIQRMSENDDIVNRYMQDSEFRNLVFMGLTKEIWEKVRKGKKLI